MQVLFRNEEGAILVAYKHIDSISKMEIKATKDLLEFEHDTKMKAKGLNL